MGVQDAIKYYNDQGGIDGVPMNLVWADSKYTIPGMFAAYTRALTKGAVLVLPQAAHESEALASTLPSDGVPAVIQGEVSFTAIPWVYVAEAPYAYAGLGFLKWLKENWDWEGKGRAPKVAIFYMDVSYSKASIKPSRLYAEKLGIDYGHEEVVPPVIVDYTPYLLRIKEYDPDFVLTTFCAAQPAAIMKDAHKLGIHERYQWVHLNYGQSPVLWDLCGDLAEDNWGVSFVKCYPYDFPGVELVNECYAKYHPGEPWPGNSPTPDPTYIVGFNSGRLGCEAIKMTAARVGVANITGTEVKKTLDSLTDFDTLGVTHPLDFSEGGVGTTAVRLNLLKNHELTTKSEWVIVTPDELKALGIWEEMTK